MGHPRPWKTVMLAGASALPLLAATASADPMPEEKSLASLEYELIGIDDLYEYKALDSYSQAPFLDKMVADGALPPVEDRLPKQPLVFKTGAMSDGIGEYGGVFRHVIGGRPEGWNWLAGQNAGWGGIDMTVQECLVRQGPRWQIKAEEQTGPLPNLAKSWEWNEGRTELTMHLIEGAKWSDGDPFDTEDIRFWWEDNVEDPNVTARMKPGTLGEGTVLTVIDDYTFKFSFRKPQGTATLEALAYIQGCPGPSHWLKDHHPRYNPDKTYNDYREAMPADSLPVPVMGAFVPVVHKPDELVVMRRNPYYWKVDEAGNQLPYHNETHYKLTTWDDRTTQAVAGTGDFSNMENPANYVEALKQSRSEDAPVDAKFGPRTMGWRIELNYAAKEADDPYDQQLRTVFRELDFRKAISHALNRDAIGQAVARGPFAYPYVAGFLTGSPYYSKEHSEFQSYDQDKANALLDGLGLTDSDGNGIRNLPDGGEDLTIDMVYRTTRPEDRKQVDAVASQLAEVGIRVLPKPSDESAVEAMLNGGTFNAILKRENFTNPTDKTCRHLPISDKCPLHHQAGDQPRDTMDFEVELGALYADFLATSAPAEKIQIVQRMQELLTQNVYTIGTIQTPAALLVNKRIRNAHPGTPVFLFQWAEDGVIRERLWTAKADQLDEILPGTIAEY